MAAAIASASATGVSRALISLRFYVEPKLAPVGGAIGPGDLVAVRQLRRVHHAQPLLDHQFMPGVKPMGHRDNRIALPVTIRLVAVLTSAARPRSVAAATTTTAARAQPD